ncbi:hypothetical protein [Pandoraea sp. NPDC087047]|uniref:hypothetical protein n=1 Tax=Pandoraea sp. NPDC087047 TaxID=3364390 RepID=UPI003806632D
MQPTRIHSGRSSQTSDTSAHDASRQGQGGATPATGNNHDAAAMSMPLQQLNAMRPARRTLPAPPQGSTAASASHSGTNPARAGRRPLPANPGMMPGQYGASVAGPVAHAPRAMSNTAHVAPRALPALPAAAPIQSRPVAQASMTTAGPRSHRALPPTPAISAQSAPVDPTIPRTVGGRRELAQGLLSHGADVRGAALASGITEPRELAYLSAWHSVYTGTATASQAARTIQNPSREMIDQLASLEADAAGGSNYHSLPPYPG